MATPTVETKIWLALRARLSSLVLSPVVPVLWPAELVTLPSGTALEVTHLPNRPQRRYLDGAEPSYRQGILQIGVLTIPGAAQHQAVAAEIAGDVAGHFPADLRMPYLDVAARVSEAPALGNSFRDDKRARWVTPVTVRYHLEG